MVTLIPSSWTTDPEYINLLNYIIGRTENVESPMPIKLLVREFKEKSGVALTTNCLQHRIYSLRTRIHSFKHIDTKTKVKMLFALSASINPEFLKELKKDAFVENDDEERITHYKANDGSLEISGDHSLSAKQKIGKQESKRKSLFTSYFETKDDADAVPKNEKEKEMGNLFEFITEKCDTVDRPLSITRLADDFVEKFRTSTPLETVRSRIKGYGLEIQRMEFVDTRSKVQQLFGLSAAVNSDCLEVLRKNALVEVDERNRIVFYKANDGSIELRGDHSISAKVKLAMRESKRSFRLSVNSYFERKNDPGAVPKDEEEMWNLIELMTEKCVNVDRPLNISQLAMDFKNRFGISVPLSTIHTRVRGYCREIQKIGFLNTHTKVQQLFGLSATIDLDYLEKLRKNAIVEVDDRNRITKYAAHNGRLTLHGDHSHSAKNKSGWIQRRKNKKRMKKTFSSDGDKSEESERENGYSGDDSDEYSSEEFGSEFDSDDEKEPLDKTEEITVPSNGAVDNDNENPVRNYSPTYMSMDDNFDFDPPTERTFRPDETELGEGEEKKKITGNASVKTRHRRLSKRRHLDSALSNNQVVNSSSSGTSMNTESASSKPAKQKKIAIEEEQTSISSNQSRCTSRSMRRSFRNSSFSTFSTESGEDKKNQDAPRAEENPPDYHGPRIQEIEDYDYNPIEDSIHESLPIEDSLKQGKFAAGLTICVFSGLKEPEPSAAKDHNLNNDTQNTDNRADAVAPEPESVEESLTPQNNKSSTPPTNGKEVTSQETPIKVENEEPTAVEDHPEDVKPVTAHNSKIKFFEAMNSLVLFLDSPSLSNLQSKIHQKIRKMKGSKEVLQNNELIPAMELLVARMTNHSVIDISKTVKSVSLIQFFCYLKASILNSKMTGVEGLVNNIGGLIEKSKNKRIPMEKVANALRATLDIDSF